MKKQHILFPFVLASIAMLAVSCQKEEGTVTLGAEIQKAVNSSTKVYINDHTPCWHNGDEVYINNAAYPIMAASGASARIEDVVSSSSYRAIFPASIRRNNTSITNRSTVDVNLPAEQYYEVVGSHQRVDVPMGAYITSGSTLQFYNLCSVVRVIVSNSTNQELPLRRIMLQAENAMLSGFGTATISGESSNSITMSNYSTRHDVSLSFTNDYPATIEARGTSTFDIVVPAFPTDDVTLTLYTTDGHYCEVTKEDVALAHNTITTVTLNVTELTEMPHAELIRGEFFANVVQNIGMEELYEDVPYPGLYRVFYVTDIVFEYNSLVNSGIRFSTDNSPVPIYGNLEGTVLKISTIASVIDANPDCWGMFRTFDDEYEGGHIETIDFGNGFNTSNVTNMTSMFYGCKRLTSIDVSNFNTSNVTNMTGMFCDCSALTSLDASNFNTSNVTDMFALFAGCNSLTNLNLSSFNTSNVTDMRFMFNQCSNLTNLNLSNFNMNNVTDKDYMCSNLATTSGYCTIICPSAVQTELESGTSLPTSGVTFTWLRP